MLDRTVQIKQVQKLGTGNYLVTLRTPEQARRVRPGHFVMLKCSGDVDGPPLLRRPFSVFSVEREPRTNKPVGIRVLVKDIGVGTHKLVQMEPGEKLWALGPQGQPFEAAKALAGQSRYACLVAGGVGIAALYLLAKELAASGVTPVLFYGARTAKDLVLREHFERLGLQTVYATEDGSKGARGLVTAPLVQFLKKHRQDGIQIYACGPWAMMRAVDRLAGKYSVPCIVSLEARMGCSLGACMGCVVRTRESASGARYVRVCMEGPVMDSRRVDWDHSPM